MFRSEAGTYRATLVVAVLNLILSVVWLQTIGEYGLGTAVEQQAGAQPDSFYREPVGYAIFWAGCLLSLVSIVGSLGYRKARWLIPLLVSLISSTVVVMG